MSLRTDVKNALANLMLQVEFETPVNGKTTWAMVSRRLKMFNQIDPTMQPACFVVQHREFYENRGMGTPPVRILNVGLWAFAPTSDPDVVGDDLIDTMFDAIEVVLNKPDDIMQNELTLGGLCTYCNIDRRDNLLIRDPGDIDGQALLIVPLRIMLP